MPKYEFQVEARTKFVPDQSLPEESVFRFSYTITITNRGRQPAQLIARHWVIRDANGLEQEVRGLGVVGRQPMLQPHEPFSYTSSCELRTASGTMQGHYLCVTEAGETFELPIDLFALSMDPTTGEDPHLAHPTSRTLH